MNDEQKFYVWTTGIICTSIVIMIVALITSFHIKHCKMIENGWTRSIYRTSTWYKPKDAVQPSDKADN